jgi:hypothetical protein
LLKLFKEQPMLYLLHMTHGSQSGSIVRRKRKWSIK